MVKKFGSLLLTVVLVCSCLPYAVHAQGDVSSVISAGSETSFVVKKDRSLWGTGSNEFGQLGLGHKKEVGSFTKIMEDVVSVSAARYHTIALKRDGTLWGFGDGGDRRLPGGADLLTPAKILEDVKAASAGTGYTAAIKNDGTLWICGNFSLGDGENNSSDQFEKSLDDVKLVFAGDDNCLVIKNDDSLWIWGENSVGQIGNGSVGIPVLTATKVMDNVATAVAGVGVMAVKKDGSLWIWGASGDINNANGETPNKSPVPIKMMDGVLQVCTSANSPIYFAMKRDGTVWGVGSGHVMNSLLNKAVKQFTAITDNALSISSESRHLAVVKKDQTLWIGGQSVGGRLGYGNAEKYDHHKLSQVMTEVLDAPAPWALEEVRAAEYRKLVPPAMQSEYTKIVTRSEFCTLAITCIEQLKKMSIQDYLTAQNFDMPENSPFTDINGLSSAAKADIMAAYALGIVNGTTLTTFSPNNQITREQAAKMLTATAAALGHDTTAQYPAFSDEAAISAWAKPYIGFVFHVKIMSGVGNNEFDPHGGYQRQQAYMTMLRLYNYCFIN